MKRKKEPKAKKFIGLFLTEDFHRKLTFLSNFLDQPISALVREGINTLLLQRYKDVIDQMPEDK